MRADSPSPQGPRMTRREFLYRRAREFDWAPGWDAIDESLLGCTRMRGRIARRRPSSTGRDSAAAKSASTALRCSDPPRGTPTSSPTG